MRRATSAIILLVLAQPTHPQDAGSGTSTEPTRGLTSSLYRSFDRGASWTVVGAGLPGSVRVNALAIAGAVAVAGTDDGIFISNDRGRSWLLSDVTPTPRVQCLAVEGNHIYAGTSSQGVLVTEDGGRSWRRAAQGLDKLKVRSLATQGAVVYAGTDSQGVFVLPEGSRDWVPFGRGLPERSQVFDLAVKGRQIYAALYSKGLYRIKAEGSRWEEVGGVRPLEFLANGEALIAGHNPGGIYRSVDDGVTWMHSRGLPGDPPIWVLGEAGPNLIAGTTPGAVVLSSDHGANWTRSATGLPPGAAVVAIGDGKDYTLAAIVLSGGE